MSQNIYVGLDIGGTLSKVCIISNEQISGPTIDIQLQGKQKKMFYQRFQSFNLLQQWLKINILPHQNKVIVSVTGGGATKFSYNIKQLFSKAEIHNLNQFESNVKGIQFISKANLPVLIHEFDKISPDNIQINVKKTTLQDIQLPIQFISLGSGVNHHKIGKGANGFQRLKVDDPKTSFDGFQLQGTCLGGGYIFGLIGLLSGQRQVQKIVSLIKEQQTYKSIFSELLINLMQTAIQLSVIHNTPTIFPSGSILNTKDITQQFEKAMLLSIHPLPFKRSLVVLQSLEGYLGCIGVLFSKMSQAKET